MSLPTYTAEELQKWWPARCPRCGWRGLSRDCHGGEAMGETGDYTELACPTCSDKASREAPEAGDPEHFYADLHVEDDEEYIVGQSQQGGVDA